MKYILLLRGVNVGGNRKVEMQKLKNLLELLGYQNVSTYLNSGNAFFESSKSVPVLQKEIEKNLAKTFGFLIQILVKSQKEMVRIAKTIPDSWQKDSEQKTDIAYLFPEIDNKRIIEQLPIKKEFLDIRYTKGALYWNVELKDYNKSHLGKIIGHKLYQFMTIRNVNTARFLGGLKK